MSLLALDHQVLTDLAHSDVDELIGGLASRRVERTARQRAAVRLRRSNEVAIAELAELLLEGRWGDLYRQSLHNEGV